MAAGNNPVKLVTNDGQIFEIQREYVKMAHTIWTMIEDRERIAASGNENFILPLPMSARAFTRVCEWCKQHKDDPPNPAEDEPELEIDGIRRTDDISAWDEQFTKTIGNSFELIELFNAANFLDIKQLEELCLKTLANMIKGRSAEEIRAVFGIHDDLGPAEMEQIRIENSWILEEDHQTETS